jgi:hypothetical protein
LPDASSGGATNADAAWNFYGRLLLVTCVRLTVNNSNNNEKRQALRARRCGRGDKEDSEAM